jgi:hypothetical protein
MRDTKTYPKHGRLAILKKQKSRGVPCFFSFYNLKITVLSYQQRYQVDFDSDLHQ